MAKKIKKEKIKEKAPVKTESEIKLERLLAARAIFVEYGIHRLGQLNNVIDQLGRSIANE